MTDHEADLSASFIVIVILLFINVHIECEHIAKTKFMIIRLGWIYKVIYLLVNND